MSTPEKKNKDDAKNIPRDHTTIFRFDPSKIYYLSALTSRTKKEASAASDYSEKKNIVHRLLSENLKDNFPKERW